MNKKQRARRASRRNVHQHPILSYIKRLGTLILPPAPAHRALVFIGLFSVSLLSWGLIIYIILKLSL